MQEEYTEDIPEAVQFTVNNSDYLKAAAPLKSQSAMSHEVTVEVSEIERRSQENKIRAQKR